MPLSGSGATEEGGETMEFSESELPPPHPVNKTENKKTQTNSKRLLNIKLTQLNYSSN